MNRLVQSVQRKNYTGFQQIIKTVDNINAIVDDHGNTILHIASIIDPKSTPEKRRSGLQILESLLQNPKIDLNARNLNWETPLWYACSIFSIDAVSTFCHFKKHFPKKSLDLDAYDVSGKTALMRVSERLYQEYAPEIISYLLWAGANYRMRSRQYIDEWIVNKIQEIKQMVWVKYHRNKRRRVSITERQEGYPKLDTHRFLNLDPGKTAYQIGLSAFYRRFPSPQNMFMKEWYISNDFRLSDLKIFGIQQLTTSPRNISRNDEKEFRTSIQSLVLLLHALDIEHGVYFRWMLEHQNEHIGKNKKPYTQVLSVTQMREQIFPLIRNMKPDLLKQLYLQYL